MKEKITMSYEDLFNYVIQSRVLGDMLNENKLAEVGFEIPHLVYIQKIINHLIWKLKKV